MCFHIKTKVKKRKFRTITKVCPRDLTDLLKGGMTEEVGYRDAPLLRKGAKVRKIGKIK